MKYLLGVVVVLVGSSAQAQREPEAPPASAAETPWGKGVSPERRLAAEAKLGEGNALFLQNKFREALAAYEQALASWDHPAIRFNVVRCLIALDRPLDAWNNIERALAFGKEPFEDQLYTEALNYKRLLAGQIATVEVTCAQPSASIKLDGTPLVQCPGTITKQLSPGMHVLVAQGAKLATLTRDVMLLPGKTERLDIRLESATEAVVYRSRWKTWQPWVVVGSGALVAAVGLLVDRAGRSQLDDLLARVEATCAPTECTAEQRTALAYESTESSAIFKNRLGLGLAIGGGVVALTGVAGVILNRPRAYPAEQPRVTVTPTATPHGAGLAVKGAF